MNGQVISDEVLDKVETALSKGNNWMAYNNSLYFIDPNDIFFFDNKDEASEFADNNISDRDHYVVIPLNKQLLINKNNKVMNEKNLGYLKDNLKYLGFGESLQSQMEDNIRQAKPEFTLQHEATYNNQKMESTLHFKQGNENEMYFFNKYDAKLLQPEERAQTFYLDKGNGVTTKEAFNLLNGRAVHKELVTKEGQEYKAWVQLDLSKKEESGNYKLNRYHENYGYDLDKALQQYPIKELGEAKSKEDLMRSAEKGNLQAVKMEVRGKEETHFIQADPQYKDINVFNKNHGRLDKDQVASLKSEVLDGQSGRQEQKQKNNQEQGGGGDDDSPELKKKRTRKKGMAI